MNRDNLSQSTFSKLIFEFNQIEVDINEKRSHLGWLDDSM